MLKKETSTIFKESNILTQTQSVDLIKLIKWPLNRTWTLRYQATINGFDAQDFHSRCDQYNNTLTVIKTTRAFIFGGFTTANWSGSTQYKRDPNAFIFSLINSDNLPSLLTIKTPLKAIVADSTKGPVFGMGFDFSVANQSNINTNSSSQSDNSYQITDFKLTKYREKAVSNSICSKYSFLSFSLKFWFK